MEFIKGSLFSRQGKASAHNHPDLYDGPKRKPKKKIVDAIDISQIGNILQDLEKQRVTEETAAKLKPTRPTSSFVAVSREQYEFAFRNRTGSPRVGAYTPRYNFVHPNNNNIPKINNSSQSPREKVIFLPNCLDDDLNCTFPKSCNNKSSLKEMTNTNMSFKKFDERLNRTISCIKDYDIKIDVKEGNICPIPEKFQKKSRAPLPLHKQKRREEFVKPQDPPNEKRFDFDNGDSPVHTRTKRSRTISFNKMMGRKEFFEEKISLGPYERNEEVLIPKLSRLVLGFDKLLERKPLVLEHTLNNPQPIELRDFEKAHFKLSHVRGPYKIPSMSTTTERDDVMYRTLENYMLNVPEKQSAMTPPRNSVPIMRYSKIKI
ncbi:unnamed protein product [Blepharisma stoltei]|uniref:Protein phosphatase 1 regulatory subunit 35 C-terminal domain-containing protein n=1 Tax=Blepharisma stoltei TaxID=1481888 RepID=A0AAU9JQL8_9CILI|nr:unnamed protein product [Blepharisma stoltei]